MTIEYAEFPVEEKVDGNRTEYSHKSYGMVSFARTNTNGCELFGSSIDHGTIIRLSIKQATMDRDAQLNKDWYHSSGPSIATVYLSQNQFSELLTNMNFGDGVPCTIEHTQEHRFIKYKAPFDKTPRAKSERHFNEFANKIAKTVREGFDGVQSILDKPTINKKDRIDILKKFERVAEIVSDSLPYAEKMFHESTEKTIAEAKDEIDAVMTNLALKIGVDAMRQALPRLAESIDIPSITE